jgi:hypothetical protein
MPHALGDGGSTELGIPAQVYGWNPDYERKLAEHEAEQARLVPVFTEADCENLERPGSPFGGKCSSEDRKRWLEQNEATAEHFHVALTRKVKPPPERMKYLGTMTVPRPQSSSGRVRAPSPPVAIAPMPVVVRSSRAREHRYRRASSGGSRGSPSSDSDSEPPGAGNRSGLTALPPVCPRCRSSASVRRGVPGLRPSSWSCRWCFALIVLEAERPAREAK